MTEALVRKTFKSCAATSPTHDDPNELTLIKAGSLPSMLPNNCCSGDNCGQGAALTDPSPWLVPVLVALFGTVRTRKTMEWLIALIILIFGVLPFSFWSIIYWDKIGIENARVSHQQITR